MVIDALEEHGIPRNPEAVNYAFYGRLSLQLD
jgi:hypothetical protein